MQCHKLWDLKFYIILRLKSVGKSIHENILKSIIKNVSTSHYIDIESTEQFEVN